MLRPRTDTRLPAGTSPVAPARDGHPAPAGTGPVLRPGTERLTLARLLRLWTDVRARGMLPDLAEVYVTSANCAYDLAPQGDFPASVRIQAEPGKLPVPVFGVISQDSPRRVPGRAAGEVDHTVGKLGH